MSNISTIRAIIQDLPVYQKEEITLTAGQLSIQLYYNPAVATSVTVTGTGVAFAFNDQNGVLTFVSAPGAVTVTVEYYHVLLLDSTIQALIDLEADSSDSMKIPAAQCLDAIASSQALIQKKMKMLDFETDGPALAKALRDHAAALRDQVYGDEVESTFDVAEEIYDEPSRREKIVKDWQRQGLL